MLLVLVLMMFSFIFMIGWLPTTTHACSEEERIALLQLKHSLLNFPNGTDSLPSWGSRETHDCCDWEGITCNDTTRRVTELNLGFARDEKLGDWYLNASLFLPFQQLNALYLSGNRIAGCVENEGFGRLWKLGNLEVLYLSENKFNNISILISSLSVLSSLTWLDLLGNQLKGSINIHELNRLRSLEFLDLIGNEIESFRSYHGGEELLKLNNLKYLHLRYNRFDNNILSFLKGLSSLKSLDVGYNRLKGKLNLKEMESLGNLEELDLSGNEISGFVGSRGLRQLSILWLNNITRYGRSVQLLQSLGALPNLTILHLGDNDFKGTIFREAGLPNLKNLQVLDFFGSTLNNSFLQTIGTIPSLKTLTLYDCGLSGTIPTTAQGLCELRHLQELYMSDNDLIGNLPLCLANLTSLQRLDLSSNYFTGDISCLANLTSLQRLDISSNHFTGDISCLANLTSLQQLYLSSNHFTGDISLSPLQSLQSIQYLYLSDNHFQIPLSLSPFFNLSKLQYLDGHNNEVLTEEEAHNLTPKFQLETLYLNGRVHHGGAFPKFLHHQHNLQYVDLSNLKIKGEFPDWLLENNTNLHSLSLANNSISGQFRLPSHSRMNLSDLDISKNNIQGNIPAEIGVYLPGLTSLSMHGNGLAGSIPSSFGNMSSLAILDLSSNVLTGRIPEHLTIGCSMLGTLVLSNNSLQGQIFSRNINLKSLWWLLLDGNKFIGGLPDSLFNCTYLTMLDVSKNSLSGRIPGWMGKMSSLLLLDLSHNNFSGILPSSFFSSPVLQYVYLSKNKFQGPIAGAFYDCLNLLTLDLSHNSFTGSIPEWIDKLSQLSFLLLSYNNLEGEIPIQLCKLEKLSLIDLSHNNLSGHVLPCLRSSSDYNRLQEGVSNYFVASAPESLQQSLEITTKNVPLSYQGSILKYISGIDLSYNNLTGTIPYEFGNLGKIKVLNLSYNSLTGPIPPTFSNLKEIESLDLSYNMLDGNIPLQITELYSLEVFSVAHNNLSGKTPERKAQFATFEESSYKDNPFLCGLPLPKSCGESTSPSPTPTSLKNEAYSDFMDMEVFYVTFAVTYAMVLLGIAAVLYINPHWRRVWFYLIEVSINKCYYFLVDNLPFLSKFRFSNPCFS